jgi:hypothetical protein
MAAYYYGYRGVLYLTIIMAIEGHRYLTVIMARERPPCLPSIMSKEGHNTCLLKWLEMLP